jgi:hypothetical protein
LVGAAEAEVVGDAATVATGLAKALSPIGAVLAEDVVPPVVALPQAASVNITVSSVLRSVREDLIITKSSSKVILHLLSMILE